MTNVKLDTFYKSLINKTSTEQVALSGGRILYAVKITAKMAVKNNIQFARWIETDNFALRNKSDVSGNYLDEGYILIDKRGQEAYRRR